MHMINLNQHPRSLWLAQKMPSVARSSKNAAGAWEDLQMHKAGLDSSFTPIITYTGVPVYKYRSLPPRQG